MNSQRSPLPHDGKNLHRSRFGFGSFVATAIALETVNEMNEKMLIEHEIEKH